LRPLNDGMRDWWTQHAEQRDANIHTAPEAFGLDLDRVRTQFGDYTRRMHEWTAAR